jgi:hypothetical protein
LRGLPLTERYYHVGLTAAKPFRSPAICGSWRSQYARRSDADHPVRETDTIVRTSRLVDDPTGLRRGRRPWRGDQLCAGTGARAR